MNDCFFDVNVNALLTPVVDIQEALALANSTENDLTTAVRTSNVVRVMWFSQLQDRDGNINLGTFGSETHMPFAGLGSSGNRIREPSIGVPDDYRNLRDFLPEAQPAHSIL
jgi:acyl-CoA reductase-like NAD-dependent aldehyde dehydrogenase